MESNRFFFFFLSTCPINTLLCKSNEFNKVRVEKLLKASDANQLSLKSKY